MRAYSEEQIYNALVDSWDRKSKLAMAKARVTSKSRNAKNARKRGKSEFVVLKLRRDELELLKAKIHEVATRWLWQKSEGQKPGKKSIN